MKDSGTKSRFFEVEAGDGHLESSSDDQATSTSGSIRHFVVPDEDYDDSGSETKSSSSDNLTVKDAEHSNLVCTPPSAQRCLDEVYRQNAIDLEQKRSKRKRVASVSGLERSVLSLDRAGRALMEKLVAEVSRFRREVDAIHNDLQALQRLLRWEIEDESFVETTLRNMEDEESTFDSPLMQKVSLQQMV